ncbi:kelch-like protein 10 [Corticium candelabrum]|uniref:kelch-like protein 10 n=1 Tax=Corticium candelabrum TaxID=121492 RepID=UPI002E2528C2|nr:kelch-like protein 10 [Corticium candelabrum]
MVDLVAYHDPEHANKSFLFMDKLRRSGTLCDVSLSVRCSDLWSPPRLFNAHKLVLVSSSSYFSSIFLDDASQYTLPICFDDIDPDAFESLLTFAYTSKVHITEENVHALFHAADLLRFDGVLGACFRFLKSRLCADNCLSLWTFARAHRCHDLTRSAFKMIETHFTDISKREEFLNLTSDQLVDIVTSDELCVTGEEEVYEPVIAWFKHDVDGRKEKLWTVMQHIKLNMLGGDFLMNVVEREMMIQEDANCLDQLIDALENLSKDTEGGPRMTRMGSLCWSGRRPTLTIEDITLAKGGRSLGFRVMGGVDRPSHVFRIGDKPGLFVLKIIPAGAAWNSSLRVGDRVLAVNGVDIQHSTHHEAVQLLSKQTDALTLTVRHEPPPPGLKEVNLLAKPGQGFGLSIRGGVNGYAGNPADPSDEGIFISQIIPGGAASQEVNLRVGMRILQVNSQSLLGATHVEARRAFQEVIDRLSLLICKGFDPMLAELHNLDAPYYDSDLTGSHTMLRYEAPETSEQLR